MRAASSRTGTSTGCSTRASSWSRTPSSSRAESTTFRASASASRSGPGLERLSWYGRGPWENYSDRLASALVGRFESTVADEYVPYIVPQEHGHHSDTRWLSLQSDAGLGLRVEGRPTIGFSASHFTAADLYGALHTCDLEPRREVFLNLDHAQRGLGTASCGPDTAERYRLLERSYRFTYALRPFAR